MLPFGGTVARLIFKPSPKFGFMTVAVLSGEDFFSSRVCVLAMAGALCALNGTVLVDGLPAPTLSSRCVLGLASVPSRGEVILRSLFEVLGMERVRGCAMRSLSQDALASPYECSMSDAEES